MEKITIKLPEDISEITLDQYQRFELLSKRTDLDDLGINKRIINIFTGLKYKQIDNIPYKDYEGIIEQITKALKQSAPFQNRFKIQDVEFGFIPNLDDMATAEFVDLSNHGLDIENYHKIMAVLFRPISETKIKRSWIKRLLGIKKYHYIKDSDRFGNYKIVSYTGTKEHSDVMKYMTMDVVLGALGFFYHLANELRTHTQRYTKADLVREDKQAAILKSGDGMLV